MYVCVQNKYGGSGALFFASFFSSQVFFCVCVCPVCSRCSVTSWHICKELQVLSFANSLGASSPIDVHSSAWLPAGTISVLGEDAMFTQLPEVIVFCALNELTVLMSIHGLDMPTPTPHCQQAKHQLPQASM